MRKTYLLIYLCFILTLLGSLEGVTHAEQAVPVGAESLSPKEWASIEEQIAAVAEPQNSDLTSTPIAKLQATPPIVNDNLGWVVSVQGDIAAVVGNGPQAEGRVYIFYRNFTNGIPDAWELARLITVSESGPGQYFASDVDLHGDLLAVGSGEIDVNGQVDQGVVHLFARNQGGTNQWGQVKVLTASDGTTGDYFGYQLQLNDDWLAVSAPDADIAGNINQGAVYLFKRNQGGANAWGEAKKLTASDGATNDKWGTNLELSQDILVVSSPFIDIAGDQDQGAAYIFYRNNGGADQWGFQTKVIAMDGDAGDYFYGLALAGDTLAVAARLADIDGRVDQGAVYLFERNQGGLNAWGQVKKVTASDGAAGDRFSRVNLEGDVLAVGAHWADVDGRVDQGAVYLFERNEGGTNNWGEVEKLVASDGAAGDFFGIATTLSGNTLMVGAYYATVGGVDNAGAVYVYYRTGAGWRRVAQPVADNPTSNGWLGFSVALHGRYLLVGAPYATETVFTSGKAYLFERNEGGADAWELARVLDAPDATTGDSFGYAVTIYDDTAVVGARDKNGGTGAAYVYYRNKGGANNWGWQATLTGTAGSHFGAAVSLDGDKLAVGAPQYAGGLGAVTIYERNQGGLDAWGVLRFIPSATLGSDQFGAAVSLEFDVLLVGAPYADTSGGNDAGEAHLYQRNNGGADNWGAWATLRATDGQTNDHFGRAVALSDDTALVGAPDNDLTGSDQGAAYLFSRNQGGLDAWAQVAQLMNPTGQTNDRFGFAVDVRFDVALVGAPRIQVGNNANQGRLFLYERNIGGLNAWGQRADLFASNGSAEDRFGFAVALGDVVLATGAINVDVTGEANAGAAYVYQWETTVEAPIAQNDNVLAIEDLWQPVPVLENDSDPDGTSLTVVAVSDPPNGTAIFTEEQVGYLSNANYFGSDEFTYTIMDSDGLTSTATIFVTVQPSPEPPVAVDDETGALLNTPVAIEVLANDSDVDGDVLSVSAVATPGKGTAVISDTLVVYTPNTNFTGTDTFTYTVYDGSYSDVGLVTVDVRTENGVPVAANDTASTVQNVAVAIAVLTNDSDPDGDLLTIASVTTPGQGTAVISGTAILYTPAQNYIGNHSFNYTISDGLGGTAQAEVTVQVRESNQSPTAVNDTVYLSLNTISDINVLANDSDPEGDALTVVDISVPSNGTAELLPNQTIRYTPPTGFSGIATFTYTIADALGAEDSATVTVNISPLYLLGVVKTGTGTGHVVSDPAGIDCGTGACSVPLEPNTTITLTATAETGSIFTGWSGAASGTNPVLVVTMDEAKTITANFMLEQGRQVFLPLVTRP